MTTETTDNYQLDNFDEVVFPYLDRNEAIFALNAIKHVDCAYCPDFSFGCEGKESHVATANLSAKEYLYKQRPGTETFLCGKLRNIIIADETHRSKLYSGFDKSIKEKIGYLTKQFEKCIINDAGYDFDKKQIEINYHKQLQHIISESNRQILALQKEIQQQNENLELASKKIQQQRQEIERLKHE